MILIRSGNGCGARASRKAQAMAEGAKGLLSSPSLWPLLSSARRCSRVYSERVQRALTRLTMLMICRLSS
ncbi:hypothetical protein D3C84_1014540 [compost metagenome]